MTLWEEQWKLFAPGFENGKCHLSLKPYGKDVSLSLIPGPGFGDFSHPTTQLCLQLMAKHVAQKTVVDIGCGSGILSIAAALLGAESVYGYDIDLEAVEHAKTNGKLNQLNIDFHQKPPTVIPTHAVIVMNMISSEQMHALAMIAPFLPASFDLITSGVLASQASSYLKQMHHFKQHHVHSITENGWTAFEFLSTSYC